MAFQKCGSFTRWMSSEKMVAVEVAMSHAVIQVRHQLMTPQKQQESKQQQQCWQQQVTQQQQERQL
jgi:hypothetical protein